VSVKACEVPRVSQRNTIPPVYPRVYLLITYPLLPTQRTHARTHTQGEGQLDVGKRLASATGMPRVALVPPPPPHEHRYPYAPRNY